MEVTRQIRLGMTGIAPFDCHIVSLFVGVLLKNLELSGIDAGLASYLASRSLLIYETYRNLPGQQIYSSFIVARTNSFAG